MARAAKLTLTAVSTIALMACSLFTPKVPNAQSPASTVPATNTQAPPPATPVPSSTTASTDQPAAPTATATLVPAPTDTAQPASTATATAKPAPSDTAAPAAALVTDATAAAAATSIANYPTPDSTTRAMFGPMADVGDITLYYNPVGTPLDSWHGVPIMPQATAGQEFKPDLYSYKVTANLAEAGQYYTAKAASIGLPPFHATGFGGTGSLASHNITFLTQNFLLDIVSLDNDPQHVIVIINKAP